MCLYNYYKESEIATPRLYCRVTDNYCIYSKMCYKTGAFVAEEDYQERCKIKLDKENNSIPNGAKKVIFIKGAYVYVQVDADHVEKFINTIGEINQEYVYINNGKICLTDYKGGYKKSYNKYEKQRD